MSRPRRTDLPETDWATSALCVDMPAEIFDAAGDRVQTAKAACAHCPVARQCLRWALSHGVEDEIWGARTPRERRRLSMAFVLESPGAAASVTGEPSSAVAPTSAAAPAGSRSGPLRAPATPASASTDRPERTQPPRESAPPIRTPKARTKAPAECGTEAGYKRHRRLGEETCADCRLPTGGPGRPGRPRGPARGRCPRRDPSQSSSLRNTRRLQPTPQSPGRALRRLPHGEQRVPAGLPHRNPIGGLVGPPRSWATAAVEGETPGSKRHSADDTS